MNKELMVFESFRRFLPENSVDYCYRLWAHYRFNYKVTKKRESKLGDYRYDPADRSHTITINSDLNKYSFLVTYLHEVAHLVTQVKDGSRVKPHGEEWKNNFKEIMLPVLSESVLPLSLLEPLNNYLVDPKASSCSDFSLLKALRDFDDKRDWMVYLTDTREGQTFKFNKKIFIKGEVIRSRALCKELKTGKQYYVPLAALVELMGQVRIAF